MIQRDFIDGATVLTLGTKRRESNTGYVGIHYIAKLNTHQVAVKSRIIGWRVQLEDAVALRDEARRRVEDRTFDEWYAKLKSSRRTHKNRAVE